MISSSFSTILLLTVLNIYILSSNAAAFSASSISDQQEGVRKLETISPKKFTATIHVERPKDEDLLVPLNNEAIGVHDTMQRVDLTNAFYAAAKAPAQEDKALYSKYFYGRINGTLVESGALVSMSYIIYLMGHKFKVVAVAPRMVLSYRWVTPSPRLWAGRL